MNPSKWTNIERKQASAEAQKKWLNGLLKATKNRLSPFQETDGSATNSFAYNGLNLRTSKTDSAGTKTYITDGNLFDPII